MKIIVYITFMLLLSLTAANAQVKMVTFGQVETLQKTNPKPVLVFIHTDWCRICQGMKQTTFKNKEVINLLNAKFYVVFLNAEDKEDILFAGRKFSFKPSGINTGVHQLAEELGSINGQVAYPSICVLDAKIEIIYQYDGYLDAPSLIKIANILLKDDEGVKGAKSKKQ